MASTNKTEHLMLNSWVETDRPQRNDFNSDNLIIDTVLGEHVEDNDLHLTESEKKRVASPFVVVPYSGTGAEIVTISLPVVPRFAVVYRKGMPFTLYDSEAGVNKVYGGVAFTSGGGATGGISLNTTEGITLSQSATASDGVKYCFNEEGGQYMVIVFR